MTSIREQVRRLEMAFSPPRWPREKVDEYERTFAGIDPEVLEHAVTVTLRTWTSKFGAPPPGVVREFATGLARRQRDGHTMRKHMLTQPAQPHVPVMWFAALVASMRARGAPVPVRAGLEPFVQLASRLGLRPEHGCDGAPGYDGALVSQAGGEFAKVWASSGDRRNGEKVGAEIGTAFLRGATVHRIDEAIQPKPAPMRLPSEILADLT